MSGPDRDNPRSFNFPEGELLHPDQINNLGRAVISLTREICVLTDRQLVLEQVLAEKGIDIAEAVDRYQPDEDMQKRIDAHTGLIIQTIVGDLTGAE